MMKISLNKRYVLVLPAYLLILLQFVFNVTEAQEGVVDRRADKRPNIILIMADDMGMECLGTYGSTYHTPNLDHMAETGVKFNYAFAQAMCTPSRVQIMTGKYNYKNYTKFAHMDPHEKTFGHLAKEAGYKTAIMGKWQLGGGLDLPYHFGFEEYCLWQLNRAGSRYAKPLIQQNGKTLTTTNDDYGPDIFADYLLDFIERNKEEPFFAYYPMALVHGPFVPTPDSKEWAQDTALRHNPDFALFGDMVSYCDKIIGRIIGKLNELGLAENTIVLFTADNGTATAITTTMKDGSTVRGGKTQTIDTGIRVPLIVWGKYRYTGYETDNLVDFTDFMPTIADAIGATVPEAWDTDGVSFLPTVKGETPDNPRAWIFSHYDPKHSPGADKRAARFFRTHRYKLYHDGRFYDVAQDSAEKKPIAPGTGTDEAEQVRNMLQQQLDRLPPWQPMH
ncbi:arylsulfatase A [Parapedobacter composti]|uniref:Arylsulfatase A n=1 Tax=Parapedobacter composti TaxID=623281 RepID=A0A1I1K239_9SPHI|nr:sulfatase-like hydrolase/transferase [Parapedobacter composti]SFC51680.1 arylsulfatase A [Parapedobacter composti]